MRRSLVVSLLVVVLVAIIAFGATLAAGWSPRLGLDLAGGSEVIYQPHSANKVTTGDINQTIEILRNRVDAAGVGGATIDSQNGQIVVQLPNIRNPQTILSLIGRTAQLQFRPVLCFADPYVKPKTPVTGPLPTTCSSPSYDQTAANLNVNTSTSQATNNVPPDPALTSYPTTSPTENDNFPNKTVLVPAAPGSPQAGLRYLLGPTQVLGTGIVPGSASAVIPQGGTSWDVQVSLTSAGSTAWDRLAQQQFHAFIGIDLDGTVQSAPLTLPGQASFSSFGGHIQITGSFTHTQASNLALVLNYGALPVRLSPVNKLQVSATLGKSSLKAGLVAGLGGLLLVLIYTIIYYRALGVVVVSGLLVTGFLLWAIISALGHSALGLTLDLSGVTGIIVSVGITVDSYIVYFERLKDEARAGRSIRSSVDKSFRGAFRTVLNADAVSLAAAVVLYLLSVGTVRGFAFFLGLSTLLDVATTFFFTRPLVILLGRSRTVTEARFIGIARGLATRQEVPV